MKKALLFLAGMLALAAPSVPREESNPGNTPTSWRMANGIRVIHQRDASSATTVLHIFLGGGKRSEPEELGGLADLTCRLAMQITTEGDLRNMMSAGSSLTFQTLGDFLQVSLEDLSENLGNSLKIVSRMMSAPLINSVRISSLKEHMAFLRKSADDDPVEQMNLIAGNELFGPGGYGGSVFGSDASMEAIRKKDVSDFHAKHFTGANMILSIVSDRDSAALRPLLEEVFRRFPAGVPADRSSPLRIRPPEAKFHHLKKERIQTHVSFGYALPAFTADNFTMGLMLETCLGKGINSRLWRMREEANLAYGIHARVTHMLDAGVLTVYLKTTVDRAKEAIAGMGKILHDVWEQGIGEEEWVATKRYARSDWLRDLESKRRRSYYLGFFELMGIGHPFVDSLFLKFESVTRADMNSYIRRVLSPENRVEVIIGPDETGLR